MPRDLVKAAAAAAVAAGLSISPGGALADEFTEIIQEVLELYEAGDIGEAKSALDYAAKLLDQMKATALKGFFPEPLEGWQAEDSESEMAGAVAFGGGIAAGRLYRKGELEVEISIVADSPLVQQYAILFNNTAMVESSGGRILRINRQNAIITDENQIQMMVANRFFITIGGSADEEAKLAYAEAIDFRGLSKLP